MSMLVRCGIAAVCALSVTTANAGVLTFNSDAAFNAFEAGGGFVKQFAGSVRWGDGLAVGDWEYAIVNASDLPIGSPASTPWGGTNAHDVTFSFDGAGSATLSLSGIGSITRAVNANPTSIFARVRDSVTVFSALSNIEIDLDYNGVGVDYSYSLLTGDANAAYWGVEDPNLRFGFTLTADASLDGPRTSGSDPMYQFKVGVPEPTMLSLIAMPAVLMLRRRR